MARGVLTPGVISRTGVALVSETTGDPTNNHQVVNNGTSTFVLVHNTNGGSTARTLTVHISKTVDGAAVASKTYSIAAAATKLIGPFPTAVYGATLLLDVDNAELHLAAYHL